MSYLQTKDLTKGVLVTIYSNLHEVLAVAKSSTKGYAVSLLGVGDLVIPALDEEQLLNIGDTLENV